MPIKRNRRRRYTVLHRNDGHFEGRVKRGRTRCRPRSVLRLRPKIPVAWRIELKCFYDFSTATGFGYEGAAAVIVIARSRVPHVVPNAAEISVRVVRRKVYRN